VAQLTTEQVHRAFKVSPAAQRECDELVAAGIRIAELWEQWMQQLASHMKDFVTALAHNLEADLPHTVQKTYSPGAIQPGDEIQYRGRTCKVEQVNGDTLTFDNGEQWQIVVGESYEEPESAPTAPETQP
jgi:hypothetical protein